MDFSPGAIGNATAGAVFNLRNTRYCAWRECAFVGVRQAFRMGFDATLTNDVGSILLANTAYINGADHTMAHMIELGSGGTLVMEGNYLPFVNSVVPSISGQAFIAQTNASLNWDGLFVNSFNGSDWYYYVLSQAGGIVNFNWDGGGGQFDGPTRGFVASVDGNTQWMISNLLMLKGYGATSIATYPLDWNSAGHVTMSNCIIAGFTHYIYARAGTVNVIGCTFEACGRGSTGDVGPHPLIRFDAPNGLVTGCSYVPRSGTTTASRSVSWGGDTSGYRVGPTAAGPTAAGNNFRNLTTGGTNP